MINKAYYNQQRRLTKAAATYDEAAVLHLEVGRRLLSRLDLMTLTPRQILDLGVNTGRMSLALAKRYPQAKRIIGLDIAAAMLQQARKRAGWFSKQRFVQADAQAIPLATGQFDLIYSALVLPWCTDLKVVLQEVTRLLKPRGLFVFATYGPDTLCELRASWQAVDAYQHTLDYTDMHVIGDALLQAGLADPVLDVEHFTLQYQSVRQLMLDIKAQGANYVGSGACPGLTGKRRFERLTQRYSADYQKDGLIPATYEVVYGHAWARERRSETASKGEVLVPVSELQSTFHH